MWIEKRILQELLLVWSYNANIPLNLHKWSSSNILALLESFQPLLSNSTGTPPARLGHFFYLGCQISNFSKIQNLKYSTEILKLEIALFCDAITMITFTKNSHLTLQG